MSIIAGFRKLLWLTAIGLFGVVGDMELICTLLGDRPLSITINVNNFYSMSKHYPIALESQNNTQHGMHVSMWHEIFPK